MKFIFQSTKMIKDNIRKNNNYKNNKKNLSKLD